MRAEPARVTTVIRTTTSPSTRTAPRHTTALVTAAIVLSTASWLAGCGGGGSPAAEPPVVASPAPTAPVVVAPPSNAPAGYTLVWADEFDTDGLPNGSRWDYDTDRNPFGWYNNERQYYARERLENARVSGGKLVITARRESLSSQPDWGGQAYSSTRLITRGKAAWTYGFIEVRAKLPCGVGTWPAIWMLGTGGRWPDDGEIDIMEQVGSNPTRIFGTLHTATRGGPVKSGATTVSNPCTAFHDYQLTWTAEEIIIGVDNKPYFRSPRIAGGHAAWPFDAPQYLLLNIAIGGDLGGPVDDTIFPVTLEIEHVRVYQRQT